MKPCGRGIRQRYTTIFFGIGRIDGTSRVVEVGIGTGQATLPVLETGCTLTAVEPGANLAGMCREKFRAYPRFSVVVAKFEDFL